MGGEYPDATERREDGICSENADGRGARLGAKQEARGVTGWVPGEHIKVYKYPISTASGHYLQDLFQSPLFGSTDTLRIINIWNKM